jgi:hypothetical protein
MFPIEFPFFALQNAKPNSHVFDPFCGRGTTLYAARLRGIRATGVDSNPVAVAIAAAKVASVSARKITALAEEILLHPATEIDIPVGDFWQLCYHPSTLIEICILRNYFLSTALTKADLVLRALILGLMHGPRMKGDPSYLSNQMPRTYATKPDAAVDFWEKYTLHPPRVNTLELIRRRAHYVLEKLPPGSSGRVTLGDIRNVRLGYQKKFTHVITSPPYLGMRCYVSDQWLRNWFLGADEDVHYDESEQLGSGTREFFVVQLARVWKRIAGVCVKGAKLAVRFGALPSLKEDPAELIRHTLIKSDRPWRVSRIERVPPPPSARRQANQFNSDLSDALQEVDVYATLEV